MDSCSPYINAALYSSTVAEPEVTKSKHIILMYCYKLRTLCCAVDFVWLLFGGGIYSRAVFISLRIPWFRRDSRVSVAYELFSALGSSHKLLR